MASRQRDMVYGPRWGQSLPLWPYMPPAVMLSWSWGWNPPGCARVGECMKWGRAPPHRPYRSRHRSHGCDPWEGGPATRGVHAAVVLPRPLPRGHLPPQDRECLQASLMSQPCSYDSDQVELGSWSRSHHAQKVNLWQSGIDPLIPIKTDLITEQDRSLQRVMITEGH